MRTGTIESQNRIPDSDTALMRSGQPDIYIAIDTNDPKKAKELVSALDGTGVGFKLGLEFFMAHGHAGVVSLLGQRPLFLDLKFHDIPNTVAGAVRSVSRLNPTILNVHAAGGTAMMKAAKAALGASETRLIAVTALTSMDGSDLTAVGQDHHVPSQVLRLAQLAWQAGMNGVVCSAQEAGNVRAKTGADFMAVTPGIRAPGSAADDQKRSMPPEAAFRNGATHLVIGRPVTGAADPATAVRSILSATGRAG